MADSDSTADQWLEMQRRYWDAWMDMTRRGLEVATPKQGAPENPWSDAMEQWFKAVAPGTPKPANDFLEQMMNVGKGYFSMVEGLCKAGPASDVPGMVENWTRIMGDAFSKGASNLNPFAQLAAKGDRKGMAFWDLPFDTMVRTLSGSMPFPGDFMKAFETGKVTDLRSQLEGFLSAPAIGYARESQEQHQQLGRLLMDYEKAMGDYQAGFANLGTRSLDAFRTRMEEATKDGKTINSVREIYNLWVDACEDVYADYAMSDDFAQRYGRMVNALMAVKRQAALLVDEWLEAMNVPTASEIATLQRRVHDTRADYQRLRCQVEVMQGELDENKGANGDLERLRSELAELRAELRALRSAPGTGASKTEAAASQAAAPAAEKPKRATTRRTRTTTADKKPATTRKTGATRRKTQ